MLLQFWRTRVLTRKNVEQQLATLGPRDVLLVPDLAGFSSADFDKALGAVSHGYDSVLNDDIIRSRLLLEMGEPLDLDVMEKSLDDIYGIDVFQSVTYNLVTRDDGETGVAIIARARRWGPNYLKTDQGLHSQD